MRFMAILGTTNKFNCFFLKIRIFAGYTKTDLSMKKTILSLIVLFMACLGTAFAQKPDSLLVIPPELEEEHDDADSTLMQVPLPTV